MKMELKHGDGIIVLDECQQSEVYEFYRLHSTMERLEDVVEEKELDKTFTSESDLKVVAKRVLEIQDDYHVSEEKAIEEVFNDEEYIDKYLH